MYIFINMKVFKMWNSFNILTKKFEYFGDLVKYSYVILEVFMIYTGFSKNFEIRFILLVFSRSVRVPFSCF